MRVSIPLFCVCVIAVLACLPTGQADDKPKLVSSLGVGHLGPKLDPNCGGHTARFCDECPIDPSTGEDKGKAWCNGDCTWDVLPPYLGCIDV